MQLKYLKLMNDNLIKINLNFSSSLKFRFNTNHKEC